MNHREYSDVNIESLFIGSYVSAGMDYGCHSAMNAMLHEIEYIRPHVVYNGEYLDTYLVGGVWVNPGADREGNKVQTKDSTLMINKESALDQLTVGGERGYGFGRLKLTEMRQDCLGLSSWEVQERELNDLIVMPPDQTKPILAHIKYESGQRYEGILEPIVGREWDAEKGAGRSIAQGIVCIAPGGWCNASAYDIDGHGLWKAIA